MILLRKTITVTAFVLVVCGNANAAVIFSDDFNRPDSPVVGNGWLDAVNGGFSLAIEGGQLTATGSFPGIYRPFEFSAPVSISATMTQSSGFGGILGRWVAGFGILNDDTVGGYRLTFNRSDQNFDNSAVTLSDGATEVAIYHTLIQFGSQMDVQVEFRTDGSILGTITQGLQREVFTFGAYDVQSSGGNVFIGLGGAGTDGSGSTAQHKLDNFTISSSIPEPTTLVLLALGLVGVGARRQRIH